MRSKVQSFHSAAQARLLLIGLALMLALAAWPNLLRAQALPDFTELVERVGPAVVNIRTLERGRAAAAAGGVAALKSTPTSRSSCAASASRCPGGPIRAAGRAAATRSRSSAAWARASSSAPTVLS